MFKATHKMLHGGIHKFNWDETNKAVLNLSGEFHQQEQDMSRLRDVFGWKFIPIRPISLENI